MQTTLYNALRNSTPDFLNVDWERQPRLSLYVRTLVLLLLFVGVDWLMSRLGLLPDHSYRQPVLFIELIGRVGIAGTLAALCAGFVLTRYGALFTGWSGFEYGSRLRLFVCFLALLMAWPFSLYGYNYYFDQGHYLDRALVIACLALLWWRPVFIFPFLALVYALMWQLAQPGLGGSIFAHKLQVLHVLNLFAAFVLLRSFSGDGRADAFLLLSCCLVAASYWVAALAKMDINWILHGQLYMSPMAAYAHGWMATAEPSTVVRLATLFSWFDWPLRVFVLVTEAAFILFLLRRSLSMVLLAAIIVFHCGVFLFFGFLFWTWILLDIALLALLWSDRKERRFDIYGTHCLLLSILLIGFGSHWARPPVLGWYDTRLSYVYRIEGITDSGRRYPLPPAFFAPYEDIMTMSTFSYLVSDRAVLVGPYGVTRDAAIANALLPDQGAEDIFRWEKQLLPSRYNEGRRGNLKGFLNRYVTNRNADPARLSPLKRGLPLPQFWNALDTSALTVEEPFRELRIVEITTLFDGHELMEIRRIEVDTVDIGR